MGREKCLSTVEVFQIRPCTGASTSGRFHNAIIISFVIGLGKRNGKGMKKGLSLILESDTIFSAMY